MAVKEMKRVVVPHIQNYKSEVAPFIKGWKVMASRVNAWEDKLPGGLADDKTPDQFDPEQLKMGIKVEMEHTDDPKLAEEITIDHLTEDPAYYTKLAKMEKKIGAASRDFAPSALAERRYDKKGTNAMKQTPLEKAEREYREASEEYRMWAQTGDSTNEERKRKNAAEKNAAWRTIQKLKGAHAMTATQEKEIIKTLVAAGHESLAKTFARSRGYRVKGSKRQ